MDADTDPGRGDFDSFVTAFSPEDISFGSGVSSEKDLRICGDVSAKRVIELGVFGSRPNSLALALRGARTIAVDPSPERIAHLRSLAEASDVNVECHRNELADLGFAVSSTVDLVLCVHSVGVSDDIARLFRQVHRVLKPNAWFVLALEHPASAMFAGTDRVARRAYGTGAPGVGDVVMLLQRSNFALDAMHELFPMRTASPLVPSTLVVRARKLGS